MKASSLNERRASWTHGAGIEGRPCLRKRPFLVFVVWWPLSAKLRLKLYARLVRGYQNLLRWEVWKDTSNDWSSLEEEQRLLSAKLVSLGTALVLPGDVDWEDPLPGHDDVSSVRFRPTASTG